MKPRKSNFSVASMIYAAVLICTLISFIILWPGSGTRVIVSLSSVLLAESVVYGYSLFWLRHGSRVSRTSPVILSGAFITILYAVVVFISVNVFDLLLELPSVWYVSLQLFFLGAEVICLVIVRIYGWNAGILEKRAEDSSRNLRQHLQELDEIKLSVLKWNQSEREPLGELIKTLQANFKYSDPVSRPSMFATEDILTQQISLLKDHLNLLFNTGVLPEDWEAETLAIIESITNTLARRNLELSTLK